MFKKVLAFSLLLCVLTFTACSDDAEDEKVDGPEATTKTATSTAPTATYGQGFYDLEGTSGNTWRWMSDQGVIKLVNTGKDMKLRVIGDVPVHELKSTPTFKIALNGETLEEFTPKENVDKQFDIPAAKLGSGPTAELTINVSKFFIPKQINPKSGDERKLSFSLRNLTWEPK